MIIVTVNGSDRELADGATVTALVQSLGADTSGRGVAIALRGEVVPRSEWDATELAAGAVVEVLTAVQGG